MLRGAPQTQVQRVHTDTRTLQPGDLFVALKGERFDANDFIADALNKGASAVMAHPGRLPAGCSGLEVPDTRLALGDLARAWRRQYRLPLIAVTGSNRKTTVTQMIASILRAWQPERHLATQGNLNNDIGLPLTLLRLRPEHRIGVIELGMNHPGEIAYLAGIAEPTVAMVNNAQREHQEFMATVQAVAEENGSVFKSLPPDGTAVFPAGEEFSAPWTRIAAGRKCMISATPRAAPTSVWPGLNGKRGGTGRWTPRRPPAAWASRSISPAATTCATPWPRRPAPPRPACPPTRS